MPAPLIGVLLQLSALALFVCMDSLVKALTAHYAVPQLMWARFLFSLLAAGLFIRLTTGHLPWRSRACVPAGGLAVVYADATPETGAAHLERLLAWYRRQGTRDGVRGTELATIPSLLGGAQQGATQSVLKAA